MVALTKDTKQLKNVAGLLGTIEGIAWVSMSAACFKLHYGSDDFKPDSYMKIIDYLIYKFYLHGDIQQFDYQILTPKGFIAFVWIYFLLNLLWVLISVQLFFEKSKKIGAILQLWALIAVGICLVDVILVIVLGADYNTCKASLSVFQQNNMTIDGEITCANAILPVLVIAAKGFVLWIVNVLFAVALVKTHRQIKNRSLVQQRGQSVLLSSNQNQLGYNVFPVAPHENIANIQNQVPYGPGYPQHQNWQSEQFHFQHLQRQQSRF